MENLDASRMSVGRRERKKIETRRTIRRVALDLAIELGMEHLTIEAITEAADVSPRTFFNYFSCKEDALVTDAAMAATELRPLIVARPPEESPLHALRMVITEADPFSLTQANRERALARQRLVQENPSLLPRQLAQYSSLERELAETLAERLAVDPDQDLRPALLAGITVSVLRVALRRWTAGGPESLSELFRSSFDLLERGVLTNTPTCTTA